MRAPDRIRDGRSGKSCGTDPRRVPGALLMQVRAPAGLGTERRVVSKQTQPHPPMEARARQIRDGTSGKSCGTDQRRLPRAPSDTSEGPGRPRDGTSGKSCGTDQRRLPGALSDTSEGPGRPQGCKVGIPTLPHRPKKCSRLPAISLTQATGSPLLSALAGAAPSPEHRLVGHKQQEPTCCPRGVRPCDSGEHRS